VSSINARFFEWVQGAEFYVDLHRQAVDLTLRTVASPTPEWIDVGCGPGLVARLAAEGGANAEGIDTDPAMIRRARRHPGPARFELGDAAELPAACADVVSAASLLYGATDPRTTVGTLWAAVRPGGALLVIETTPAMNLAEARRIAGTIPSHRRRVLSLWARSRQGAAFDRSALDVLPSTQQTTVPLLDGLVEAIVVARPA
jgi:trans-aconitate methyltransferase